MHHIISLVVLANFSQNSSPAACLNCDCWLTGSSVIVSVRLLITHSVVCWSCCWLSYPTLPPDVNQWRIACCGLGCSTHPTLPPDVNQWRIACCGLGCSIHPTLPPDVNQWRIGCSIQPNTLSHWSINLLQRFYEQRCTAANWKIARWTVTIMSTLTLAVTSSENIKLPGWHQLCLVTT